MSVNTPGYTPALERPHAPPVPELPRFVGNGRPVKPSRRRLGQHASAMFALVLVVTIGAGALRFADGLEPARLTELSPAVVYAPITLEPVVVRGSAPVERPTPGRGSARRAARIGEPVAVALTAYCLKGLTRRDHYVREGIVAADPKVFPLGRYVEIYVGSDYYGRFLVDDTGGVIKGNILDIWTPTCRQARLFGRTKGTAVLVPRPDGASADTITTGRLGGVKRPR